MKYFLLILVWVYPVFSRIVPVTNSSEYSSAIAGAAAGDTILIDPGTYPDVQAPSNADGTLENPIVVKGKVPGTVIFNSFGEGLRHAPKHWTFEHIHFKGNNSYHLFHIKPGAKGYLTIRYCHFSGVADKAIKIDFAAYSAPTDVWPDYVLVENCTMELGQGGLMNNDGSDYLTCRSNYTYGFIDGGVRYVYFSKGGMAYTMFENNLLIGGRRGPLSLGGGSMSVPGATFRHDEDLAAGHPFKTIEMVNSVIRNNIVIGAYAGSQSSTTLDCEIYGNTFINCGNALWVEKHHGDPTNLGFYNNLMVNCGPILYGGTFIDSSRNTWLNANPVDVFQEWDTTAYDSCDFRVKTTAARNVGTGKAPNDNGWTFYALPSAEYYDFYGNVRPSPLLRGATVVYSGTGFVPREQKAEHHGDLDISISTGDLTRITLVLTQDLPLVDVLVSDLAGRHVRTLYYGPMEKGNKTLLWDHQDHQASQMPAGHYFCRVSTGRNITYGKIIIK